MRCFSLDRSDGSGGIETRWSLVHLHLDPLLLSNFSWTHWWGQTQVDCESRRRRWSPRPPPPGRAPRASGHSAPWTTCVRPPSCWYSSVSGCLRRCPHTKPVGIHTVEAASGLRLVFGTLLYIYLYSSAQGVFPFWFPDETVWYRLQ